MIKEWKKDTGKIKPLPAQRAKVNKAASKQGF